ncbi:pentatricopeptide repeat-containing protein, putative [Ricinus communis]|uniref:Pentatricopeptide repeat-containing protein, putative n=1 Tax=Ricinus communis TaxID=3988 RepID=B9SL37_RICCO|nr:pentatricopeptide repeat-containing protein, putative [Ricinus communis]
MLIFTNTTSPSLINALNLKNRLLQSFNSLKQLKHVHAALLRLGFDQGSYLWSMIIRSSFDFNDTTYTRLIFNQIKEPDVVLYNTMIRGLVSSDCFTESIEFYYSMRKKGFLPNNFTFPFVIKACARLLDFQLGIMMHTLVVKLGFDCNLFVNTSLVSLYAKCGSIDDALKMLDLIPESNIVSWTAIISGYIGVGKYREAIDLFRRMLETGLRPDSFTIVQVLSACIQIGDLANGEWIDRYITENVMARNVFVTTSLVDLYAKHGNMEKARCLFDGMAERDIVSWSAMIQGYASNGLPKDALDLFFKMLNAGLKPDHYAMVGFLCACARLGALELGDWGSNLMDRTEFFTNHVLGTALIDMYAKCGSMAKAWEVFKGIKGKDRAVWNAAISGLAMNGHEKAAFGLFGQMERFGIQPDGNTFVGLLCGCTHAGLVDEGRKYFHSMGRSLRQDHIFLFNIQLYK